MKLYHILFYIIVFCNVSFAQIQQLREFKAEGHTFKELYQKADQLIPKHKLDNPEFRKAFREGKLDGVFLDDKRVSLERWAWYWRDRLNEDGSFGDLFKQSELYNAIANGPGKLSPRNALVWKHEGPVRNTGGYWGMGRTTHIAFHPTQPNTWFVAAPNGGVWKTTNNGSSFTSLGEALPIQRVGIILVDPKSPNTIYISLGEKEGWWQYGMGIYKSTNGGTTWTPTGLNWKLTDNKVLYALEMDPVNTNILIAATNNGIYRTTNGGTSWDKSRTEDFSDVKFKPNNSNIVYAARNDYWGSCEVFKSLDGGVTFNQISNFVEVKSSMRLAVTLADPEFLGVNRSVDGVRKFDLSKNSGSSFEFISNLPENAVMEFSPNNTNLMYCGGVDIHKSTDGGRTWNQATIWYNRGDLPEVHADHHSVVYNPYNKDEIFICCDGGIYKYTESTKSWKEFQNGLPITQFYKMAISTTNPPVLIGGSQDNGGFIRRANGSWGNTNGGDAMWQLIDPTNAAIGYSEYWGGTAVYRTTNGFNNLTEINGNIPGNPQGQWVTPFTLNPKNPKTFMIGYHEVFMSPDRGNTFKAISNNLTGSADNDLRNVVVNPVDTNTIAATIGSTIYLTKDYGVNWGRINMITSAEVTDLEFHPKDTNRIWVTRGGFGVLKVMESKDRGKTWTNITKNFVNTPVLCIKYDEASNTLFVGTDIGLFYSDATNVSWQYYGTGLPNTSVTDIELHQTSRKMYVSTYGRGFYSIDLPDCYPSTLALQTKINNSSFILKDSFNVCFGDQITLKNQIDGIKGTYRWRGPQGLDTTMTNTNGILLGVFNSFLKTGNYSLQFTSELGCSRIDTVYIRVIQLPTTDIKSDFAEIDCSHPELKLSNATSYPGYQFEWSSNNKSLSSDPELLIKDSGTYFLIIINPLAACINSDSIVIKKIDPPTIQIETQDVKCFGDSSGVVSIDIKDGTPPFSIKSKFDFINQSNQVPSGSYIIEIVDSRKCTFTDTVVVNEPNDFNVLTSVSNALNNEGSISLMVTGATPPYRFEWYLNQVLISNQQDLKDLIPGTYHLILKDSVDCVYELDVEVKKLTSVVESKIESIQVYPNPSEDYFIINTHDISQDQLEVDLFSIDGLKQKVVCQKQSDHEVKLLMSHLNSGTYVLEIKLDSLRRKILLILINK